ncbi:MAG: DNA repair protein RecN, partial [Bacteroidota bacterium]
LSDYQTVFSEYINLSSKLEELKELNNKAVKDEDYFSFQFEELNNASLDKKLVKELEERAKFLEHAEEIKLALSESEAILNSKEAAVIDGLHNVERLIAKIQPYLSTAEELVKRLSSVSIELKDILYEIELMAGDDEFDPNELQLVNDKLSSIYSLLQKHHVQSVDELITIRDEYEEKLLSISSLDEEIARVRSKLIEIEKKLKQKSKLLTESRLHGSDKFSVAISKVLKQLGMKDAKFVVKIEQLPKYSNTGYDKVLFMFNANLGTEVGEISKIASGGELSRLMLAIKSLISKKQLLPTVIFDEIDSGVSGEIAGKVGAILKNMASNHQVISISHLPQIASKADYHYKVYKLVENNSTVSTISKLSDEGRVEELAKMLSSEKVTAKAIDVARELMSN